MSSSRVRTRGNGPVSRNASLAQLAPGELAENVYLLTTLERAMSFYSYVDFPNANLVSLSLLYTVNLFSLAQDLLYMSVSSTG